MSCWLRCRGKRLEVVLYGAVREWNIFAGVKARPVRFITLTHFYGGYLNQRFQKSGTNSTSKVNISSRPSSMATHIAHFDTVPMPS